MLCLKRTKSRSMIYFGAFLLSLLFTSLFGSSSSFATSISCSINYVTPTVNGTLSFSDLGISCDTSSLDSDSIWYYYGDWSVLSTPGNCYGNLIIGSSSSIGGLSTTNYYSQRTSSVITNNFLQQDIVYSSIPFFVSDYGPLPYYNDSVQYHYSYFNFYVNNSCSKYVINHLNISDSISFDSSLPTSSLSITSNGNYNVQQYGFVDVDVPPVYGDYHNDLIAINNSIMICASVCLVIYFFYCIYRMIIRSLK